MCNNLAIFIESFTAQNLASKKKKQKQQESQSMEALPGELWDLILSFLNRPVLCPPASSFVKHFSWAKCKLTLCEGGGF
jgi:hypothetical protein